MLDLDLDFFRFISILVQFVQGLVQKTSMSYLGTSPVLIYKNGKLIYSSEMLKIFAITVVSSSKSIFK